MRSPMPVCWHGRTTSAGGRASRRTERDQLRQAGAIPGAEEGPGEGRRCSPARGRSRAASARSPPGALERPFGARRGHRPTGTSRRSMTAPGTRRPDQSGARPEALRGGGRELRRARPTRWPGHAACPSHARTRQTSRRARCSPDPQGAGGRRPSIATSERRAPQGASS
jgi:hypothetical protein